MNWKLTNLFCVTSCTNSTLWMQLHSQQQIPHSWAYPWIFSLSVWQRRHHSVSLWDVLFLVLALIVFLQLFWDQVLDWSINAESEDGWHVKCSCQNTKCRCCMWMLLLEWNSFSTSALWCLSKKANICHLVVHCVLTWKMLPVVLTLKTQSTPPAGLQ